jgi:hypothetical protein
MKLPHLNAGKIVVENPHYQYERDKKHGNGSDADGLKDFFCHAGFSIL